MIDNALCIGVFNIAANYCQFVKRKIHVILLYLIDGLNICCINFFCQVFEVIEVKYCTEHLADEILLHYCSLDKN